MEKYLEILKKCPLFNGVEETDLVRMLGCLGAKVVEFDKKYTVFAEGTKVNSIGIMLSGTAHVTKGDFYGNRSILSVIKPGELFAEAFACSGTQSMPINVTANEQCQIMFINAKHILQTCSNSCSFHQKLIYNLMKNLADKNVEFHSRMQVTSKRTTREKIMEYLFLESQKAGSKLFEIPFDRQELADYLEVDRSGLSTEIGKLKKEGIIDCHKNTFKIL